MRKGGIVAKARLNLSIERAALDRGRRYSELHGTSISRLVNDFLAGLPLEEVTSDEELTPTVTRLLGVAERGPDRDEYRRHLLEKHGG